MFANGTLGSARLVSSPVSWSAVGTLLPAPALGGGSCGSGAPTAASRSWRRPVGAATEAIPTAAAPMAPTAATPVATNFTVFMVPPLIGTNSDGRRQLPAPIGSRFDGVDVPLRLLIRGSGRLRYDRVL